MACQSTLNSCAHFSPWCKQAPYSRFTILWSRKHSRRMNSLRSSRISASQSSLKSCGPRPACRSWEFLTTLAMCWMIHYKTSHWCNFSKSLIKLASPSSLSSAICDSSKNWRLKLKITRSSAKFKSTPKPDSFNVSLKFNKWHKASTLIAWLRGLPTSLQTRFLSSTKMVSFQLLKQSSNTRS